MKTIAILALPLLALAACNSGAGNGQNAQANGDAGNVATNEVNGAAPADGNATDGGKPAAGAETGNATGDKPAGGAEGGTEGKPTGNEQ